MSRHLCGALAGAAFIFSLPVMAADPPAPGPKEEVILEGQIHFKNEFILTLDKVADQSAEKCVSGYLLPPNRHIAAAKTFEGKRVIVTGKLVPLATMETTKPERGMRYFSDACKNPLVLAARKIEPQAGEVIEKPMSGSAFQ